MGKIVVFENISLDGVIQDPTGEEGLSTDDWRQSIAPADREAWEKLILDSTLSAHALLLGRRSYEFFAARYPGRTGALADQMNGMPKYVVSTTLDAPHWHNSTVLGGDVVAEVAKLKAATDGELRVYASGRLVHTLLAHDLVDELRLALWPILMGAGSGFFDQADSPKPLRPKHLRLVESHPVGDAIVLLRLVQTTRTPSFQTSRTAPASPSRS